VLVLRGVLHLTDPSLTSLLVVATPGVLAFLGTVWALDRDHLREAARLVRSGA
jgi:hypothetical protein